MQTLISHNIRIEKRLFPTSLSSSFILKAMKKDPDPSEPTQITQGIPDPVLTPEPLEGITNIENLNKALDQNQTLTQIKIEYEEKSQPKLSQEEAQKIINNYASKTGVSFPLAALAAATLIQLGGTNASNNNIKCKLAEKEFHIKELREAIAFTNKKVTVRQLARTLSDTIIKVAKRSNIPGVLAKTLQNENPGVIFTDEELIYASEWNLENTSCPERVRKFLADRAKQKKEQTKNQKPQDKNKGKKGK
jgi:hypothetical protein